MGTNDSAVTNKLPECLVRIPGHLPSNDISPGHQAWGWAELCRIARHQIDKFISLVPPILRNGDLEAINKIRVTTRRLEQILGLLYCEPRPKRIREFHRQMKVCRRALGELRNCDALLTMADQSLSLKTASNIQAWKALKEYLAGRRLENSQKAMEKLRRINFIDSYWKLKRDLDSEFPLLPLSKNNGAIREEANRGNDLNRRILHSLNDRWRAFERAVEKSRYDQREEVIHQMRIAAKRLRYLTEAMKKLQVPRSSETLAWLSNLQEVVGLWRDRELLQHALTDMLAHERFRDNHPGLEADVRSIIRCNREVKQQLERRFSWMTSHSRHYLGAREWVAQMLISEHVDGVSRCPSSGPFSIPAQGRSGRQA